jgi:hypothetical protein
VGLLRGNLLRRLLRKRFGQRGQRTKQRLDGLVVPLALRQKLDLGDQGEGDRSVVIDAVVRAPDDSFLSRPLGAVRFEVLIVEALLGDLLDDIHLVKDDGQQAAQFSDQTRRYRRYLDGSDLALPVVELDGVELMTKDELDAFLLQVGAPGLEPSIARRPIQDMIDAAQSVGQRTDGQTTERVRGRLLGVGRNEGARRS